MSTTPVSLLQRLRAGGDAEDWDRFIRLVTPLILSWARGAGLREENVRDVTQEVFLTCHRKLSTFSYDKTQSFHGWLRTMTFNKVCDFRKSPATRPLAPGDAGLSGVAAPDDASATAEEEYRRYVVGRALRVIRADFPSKTWKAFWEHRVCRRPAEVGGGELGMSANAVYAAALRVLTRLREELTGLID